MKWMKNRRDDKLGKLVIITAVLNLAAALVKLVQSLIGSSP